MTGSAEDSQPQSTSVGRAIASESPTLRDPIEGAEPEELSDDDERIFQTVAGALFDPEPQREKRRGQLAVGAFVFLGLTVLLLIVPVVFGWRRWSELEALSSTVLPLVVGIVGTISGFYFGSNQPKR